MAGICEGRVVIVTGAGRGLGRAHAPADKGDRWEPAELGPVVHDMLAKAALPAGLFGQRRTPAEAH